MKELNGEEIKNEDTKEKRTPRLISFLGSISLCKFGDKSTSGKKRRVAPGETRSRSVVPARSSDDEQIVSKDTRNQVSVVYHPPRPIYRAHQAI